MPENKQIHDLPIAEQTSSSDLFETEIPSQLMQSGYASRKVSAAEIADLLLNDMTYPQALQTTAKKIIPAINEAAQSGGGGASVVQKTMAEYTALPSTEKMNGSIYKITDKALIYCLDEEYHALKEIASADYALLSSAEKNNGTLYILTDEETTAADIPYSAGVSVADKLDSLNNTVITPTYTAQSNFTFPYNNNRVVRSGNVVMVYLGVHCDTPYGANPGIKVISGLPKPDTTTNVFFTASSWNNNDSKVRVMIDTDGAIFLRVGVASHDYDVLFSYITKD